LPFPDVDPDGSDTARVYFSGRDGRNRSHIGACTLALRPVAVAPGSLTAEPLLAPGPAGAFDEEGCSMSCLVRRGGRLYLYYTGWRRGSSVPFYLGIGLAISDDGGKSFVKAPLLGPCADPTAPVLQASPWVRVEQGGWRMWYVAGVRWERVGETWRHHYLLRYAESQDGLVWQDRALAIPLSGPDENAIGRPCVVSHGEGYSMWYCHRGAAYRIGLATSPDGLAWRRHDADAGMALSGSGWDCEMQAYPAVFRYRDRWLMLYNGNGYGATGFGWATAAVAPR
jgi:hypothetical protein